MSAKFAEYYYNNKEKVLEKQKAYKKNRYATDGEFREKSNKNSKLDYIARCINALLTSLEITKNKLESTLKEPIEINSNYYRIRQYRANIKELEGKIEARMLVFNMINLTPVCIPKTIEPCVLESAVHS
jgi:hypothetical protein